MGIKVARTILKDFFLSGNPMSFVLPIVFLLTLLMVIPAIEKVDETTGEPIIDFTSLMAVLIPIMFLMVILPLMLGGGIFPTNARQIIKIANIEKRMEKLKKLGTTKFIQQTKAELVDSSHRGNKLYASTDIIPGKKLKFLVYQDKSTPREYISFVENHHVNADQAMGSKFKLSNIEYSKLKLENEA